MNDPGKVQKEAEAAFYEELADLDQEPPEVAVAYVARELLRLNRPLHPYTLLDELRVRRLPRALRLIECVREESGGDLNVFQQRLIDVARDGDRLRQRIRGSRLSEAIEVTVDWVWPKWIPAGAVTVVQSDPGVGKSMVVIDLTARLSVGAPPPTGDKLPRPPVQTIYVTADDAEGNLKARLEAAGGDPARVVCVDPVARGLKLPSRLFDLQVMTREHAARLVVIDLLEDALDDGYHLGDRKGMRHVVAELGRIARDTGAAVVVTRHLTKATGRHRGVGSTAISGAVSVELQIDRHPDDDAVAVLTCLKMKHARRPEPLAFVIEDGPRINWTPTNDIVPVSRGTPGPPPKERLAAEHFLLRQLAYGRRRVVEVESIAVASGIKAKTLRRAREHLEVRTNRDGFEWYWQLPEDLVLRAQALKDQSMAIRGI